MTLILTLAKGVATPESVSRPWTAMVDVYEIQHWDMPNITIDHGIRWVF